MILRLFPTKWNEASINILNGIYIPRISLCWREKIRKIHHDKLTIDIYDFEILFMYMLQSECVHKTNEKNINQTERRMREMMVSAIDKSLHNHRNNQRSDRVYVDVSYFEWDFVFHLIKQKTQIHLQWKDFIEGVRTYKMERNKRTRLFLSSSIGWMWWIGCESSTMFISCWNWFYLISVLKMTTLLNQVEKLLSILSSWENVE